MQHTIAALKVHVSELASDASFIHHKWFIEYHLSIVARIAAELTEYYPEADKELVEVMAWMHDYSKILDYDNEHNVELLDLGKEKMIELGFSADFATKVRDYIEWVDKKNELDLHVAPIEVKIVSSADAGSHFASPFHSFYWYEHPEKSISDLIDGKAVKINTDWQKKIVLPEAKAAFTKYYDITLVHNGKIPDKFIV